MDFLRLSQAIDNVASSGAVLSVEQKTALASSLRALAAAERFSSVQFWGKIAGNSHDYFLAQGFNKTGFTERKAFYR